MVQPQPQHPALLVSWSPTRASKNHSRLVDQHHFPSSSLKIVRSIRHPPPPRFTTPSGLGGPFLKGTVRLGVASSSLGHTPFGSNELRTILIPVSIMICSWPSNRQCAEVFSPSVSINQWMNQTNQPMAASSSLVSADGAPSTTPAPEVQILTLSKDTHHGFPSEKRKACHHDRNGVSNAWRWRWSCVHREDNNRGINDGYKRGMQQQQHRSRLI